MSVGSIVSRPEGTAYDNQLADWTRVVRRFRRLFNALNYVGRRGADSTDWADNQRRRACSTGLSGLHGRKPSPCQGEGRGFESRRPLQTKALVDTFRESARAFDVVVFDGIVKQSTNLAEPTAGVLIRDDAMTADATRASVAGGVYAR